MGFTLGQLRRAKGYTISYMASSLGIHYNTYSKWEKKPEKMPVAHAIKCAEILGFPFDDIIFSSETPQ